MKSYLLLIICAVFISLTLGCNDEKKPSDESRSVKTSSDLPVSKITTGVTDAKQNIKNKIDLALAKYRTDLIVNIMQLFQHSIWILADERSIQKTLEHNGLQMVGGLIRGDQHESLPKEIWGVSTPPMSGGQAYVATNSDSIFVVFRSTDADDGWDKTLNVLTDLKAYYTNVSFLDDVDINFEKHGSMKVHSGFHNEYLRYREEILDRLGKHPNKDIYVTGHSLGGALAVLNGMDITAHTGRKLTLITFGQPRVGNSAFRQMSDDLIPNTYRVVMDRDPVSRIPGSLLDYQHTGKLIQLDDKGRQLAPESLETGTVFLPLDFPLHHLKTYYSALLPLLQSCIDAQKTTTSASCLDLTWLVTAAESERSESKKAWDIAPEISIPWNDLDISKLPIEAPEIPGLTKTIAEFKLPELTTLADLDQMIINGFSLDKLPLDRLPIDDIDLKSLLPDIPIQKPDLRNILN